MGEGGGLGGDEEAAGGGGEEGGGPVGGGGDGELVDHRVQGREFPEARLRRRIFWRLLRCQIGEGGIVICKKREIYFTYILVQILGMPDFWRLLSLSWLHSQMIIP